jgi:hypothetical protein
VSKTHLENIYTSEVVYNRVLFDVFTRETNHDMGIAKGPLWVLELLVA